jgi:hypothetical protein
MSCGYDGPNDTHDTTLSPASLRQFGESKQRQRIDNTDDHLHFQLPQIKSPLASHLPCGLRLGERFSGSKSKKLSGKILEILRRYDLSKKTYCVLRG